MDNKNYRVILVVSNFQTDSDLLDFGDYTIKKLESRQEAAEWRSKLSTKMVPEYILIKDYMDYVVKEDDISGFDNIMNSIMNLLLTFRLFKFGDIFFNDMLIKNLETGEGFHNTYDMHNTSTFRYVLKKQDGGRFIEFRKKILPKIRLRNKYLNYSLGRFMDGTNKYFFYRKEALQRIVDYVMALESLFLLDHDHWFLRRRLAKRISTFLDEERYGSVVKKMYDERSNIVHGNYIDIDKSGEEKLLKRLEENMIHFECIMRLVFNKMLDIQFTSIDELRKYMKDLYDLPLEVVKEMDKARRKCVEQL